MFFYTAYQLNIQAEIPIPEFLPGEPNGYADVAIRRGAVPLALENPTGKGVLYQATANQFLLNMDGIGRYLVQNGNEIIVDPAEGGLESDVRVFLLGSCMGALLHQRGLLVLHASAIHTDRGAVLFTGHSGSGKSTLLGELMRRGYQMMVDDVCATALNEAGQPLVLPGYPRTRLWSDAAQKLDQDIHRMERTRPALEKYERQVTEQFFELPARLYRIYLLTTVNKDELRLEVMPRIRTFSTVLYNTYRQQFLDGLELRTVHFNLAAAVAKETSVTRISRPMIPFRLIELADRIEEDLKRG